MNNIKSWAEDDSLVQKYAEFVMDSMDMKTMEQFVFDTLVLEYLSYTPEQLATEITEMYGDEWFADNGMELPQSQD
jgi:hypothetical protein